MRDTAWKIGYTAVMMSWKRMYTLAMLCALLSPCLCAQIRIPFTLSDHAVLLQVRIGAELYRMQFDTGAGYCLFSTRGMKKFTGGNPEAWAYQRARQMEPDASDEHLARMVQDRLWDGWWDFTVQDIAAVVDSETTYPLPDCPFSYAGGDESGWGGAGVDGLIGVSFFGERRNIIVDYVSCCIDLDAEPLDCSATPLKRLDFFQWYTTEVTINGVRQQALIDTGSVYCFVRDNYWSRTEYSAEKLQKFIQTKKVKLKKPWQKQLVFELSGVKETIIAYKTSSSLIACSDDVRKFGRKVSILGYPLFKGHRLQFDFENGVFRME